MGEDSENIPTTQGDERVTGLPANSSTVLNSEPIQLSAVVFMEPEQFRIISGWNDEFQNIHPNMTINLTNLTHEQSYLYYKEQARIGQSSDILMLDNNWISEFAARGFLSYRANEFIPIDNAASYNRALSQTKWNGYTWAIPHSVDPYIVVWNPTIVKNSAGESALPESLDEWLLLQEELLLNDPSYEGIHINVEDPLAFVSLIWALHGEWSTEINLMYTLKSVMEIEMLDKLLSDVAVDNKDGIIKPLLHMKPTPSDEYWEMFDNNQFGALVVPLSEWMARNKGTEAIATSLIGGDLAQTGLWLSGTSYAVSSQSLYQEMAFSWIAWMTNLSHQIQTLEMDYKLPVNLTTLDSNNLLSLPQSGLLKRTVEAGRAWNQDPQLMIKINLLKQALIRIDDEPSSTNQWNSYLEQSWNQINPDQLP